jgi:hypothetical protein
MSAPAPSSSLLGLGLRIAAGSAGWYAVSVSLTLFNKWILGYWVPSFRFPLAMTFCHMVFKGVIAAATIWLFALPVPTITWRQFWLHACPIGAATGLDIALSNVSFLYITVSYYTMIKPLGLLFTLLMALLLRLEQPSVALISAVMLIFSGVFLASVGETNDCSGGGDASSLEACELTGFTYIPANSSSPPCDDGTVGGCAAGVCSGGGDASSREACERTGHRFRESTFSLVGFLCVLGATVFGAIRWTVTQLMLQQHRQQQQQQQQRRQVAKGRPTAIAGGRQMPGGGKGSQQASSVCGEGLEAEETGGEAGAGAGGGLNVSSGSEEGEDPELQPLTGGAGAAAKGLAASTGLAKFPPPVPSSSMQGPAPAPGPPPPPPPRAAAVGLLDGGAVSLLMLISPAASLTLVPLVVARELADLQTFLSEEPTPVVAQALAFVVLASFLAFLLLSEWRRPAYLSPEMIIIRVRAKITGSITRRTD